MSLGLVPSAIACCTSLAISTASMDSPAAARTWTVASRGVSLPVAARRSKRRCWMRSSEERRLGTGSSGTAGTASRSRNARRRASCRGAKASGPGSGTHGERVASCSGPPGSRRRPGAGRRSREGRRRRSPGSGAPPPRGGRSTGRSRSFAFSRRAPKPLAVRASRRRRSASAEPGASRSRSSGPRRAAAEVLQRAQHRGAEAGLLDRLFQVGRRLGRLCRFGGRGQPEREVDVLGDGPEALREGPRLGHLPRQLVEQREADGEVAGLLEDPRRQPRAEQVRGNDDRDREKGVLRDAAPGSAPRSHGPEAASFRRPESLPPSLSFRGAPFVSGDEESATPPALRLRIPRDPSSRSPSE